MFQLITGDEMSTIIETRKPLGLYLLYDEAAQLWVACDNKAGDALTEEFSTRYKAERWLRGD